MRERLYMCGDLWKDKRTWLWSIYTPVFTVNCSSEGKKTSPFLGCVMAIMFSLCELLAFRFAEAVLCGCRLSV